MTSLLPLFGRLNQTTRDKLLPALADGQIGLVIDTKLKSKRFVRGMPAVADPLPMAEPALIFGVSDAELLRQACTEYKDIFNAMIDAVRKIEGSEIPARFPHPRRRCPRQQEEGLHDLRLSAAGEVGRGQADSSQRGTVRQGGRPDRLAGP